VETTLRYARTYDSTVAKEYQEAINLSDKRPFDHVARSLSMA
jgi:hypothetical protein